MIERLSTKELLAKSLKELAKTKPIDKITIKEITDNCGLSKRTFYHNFQDKAELVLFEYSFNLSKVFNAENKDLSWLELMHKAIMTIVNNYDYYRNAFHVFDSSSSPINAMKSTASSTFEDFIKLKTEIKELTEEESKDTLANILSLHAPFFDNNFFQILLNLTYITGTGPFHEGLIFQTSKELYYIAQAFPVTFISVENLDRAVKEFFSFCQFNQHYH